MKPKSIGDRASTAPAFTAMSTMSLTLALLSADRAMSTSVVLFGVGNRLPGEILELGLGQQHRDMSSEMTMQAAVSSVNCGLNE
jgi:hypothetical protein